MTMLEFRDEVDEDQVDEDQDDSPLETSSFPTEHRRRPWWKSFVGVVMILAIILAIVFALSFNRPVSSAPSSSNSELSAPEQQQQQQEQGSSSSGNDFQGTDGSGSDLIGATGSPSSATSAPATRAPVTSAPVTSIPATSVPVTSIPATTAPVTSIPATSVPLTSVPVTSAPVTSIPATSTPATSVPVTSIPATSVPTASAPATCVEEHFEVCETDRMGHETPLMAGHALCNHQFRFGVTSQGNFQWHDCAQQVTRVIYENSAISYFSMSSAGVFRLMDQNNQIIWEKAPKMKISYTPQCLPQPLLDCPYLHLHRDGVLVLNSINNSTGQWSDRNVERAFEGLFQS